MSPVFTANVLTLVLVYCVVAYTRRESNYEEIGGGMLLWIIVFVLGVMILSWYSYGLFDFILAS